MRLNHQKINIILKYICMYKLYINVRKILSSINEKLGISYVSDKFLEPFGLQHVTLIEYDETSFS